MAQQPGHELQDLVAEGVAVDVVELLEVVDIREQDAGGRAVLDRLRGSRAQRLVEMPAVREPSQAVGARLAPRGLQILTQAVDLGHACLQSRLDLVHVSLHSPALVQHAAYDRS